MNAQQVVTLSIAGFDRSHWRASPGSKQRRRMWISCSTRAVSTYWRADNAGRRASPWSRGCPTQAARRRGFRGLGFEFCTKPEYLQVVRPAVEDVQAPPGVRARTSTSRSPTILCASAAWKPAFRTHRVYRRSRTAAHSGRYGFARRVGRCFAQRHLEGRHRADGGNFDAGIRAQPLRLRWAPAAVTSTLTASQPLAPGTT